MKNKIVALFISVFLICLFSGCSYDNVSETEESTVKVTTLTSENFIEKTAAAEKWAAENVEVIENDRYKRYECGG